MKTTFKAGQAVLIKNQNDKKNLLAYIVKKQPQLYDFDDQGKWSKLFPSNPYQYISYDKDGKVYSFGHAPAKNINLDLTRPTLSSKNLLQDWAKHSSDACNKGVFNQGDPVVVAHIGGADTLQDVFSEYSQLAINPHISYERDLSPYARCKLESGRIANSQDVKLDTTRYQTAALKF